MLVFEQPVYCIMDTEANAKYSQAKSGYIMHVMCMHIAEVTYVCSLLALLIRNGLL